MVWVCTLSLSLSLYPLVSPSLTFQCTHHTTSTGDWEYELPYPPLTLLNPNKNSSWLNYNSSL